MVDIIGVILLKRNDFPSPSKNQLLIIFWVGMPKSTSPFCDFVCLECVKVLCVLCLCEFINPVCLKCTVFLELSTTLGSPNLSTVLHRFMSLEVGMVVVIKASNLGLSAPKSLTFCTFSSSESLC